MASKRVKLLPLLNYDWSTSRDVTFLEDDVSRDDGTSDETASDVAIVVVGLRGVNREGRGSRGPSV